MKAKKSLEVKDFLKVYQNLFRRTVVDETKARSLKQKL